ncbi:hypothetical protein ASPWEDRAFT_143796 [Aspergillus wentii DTO 134E9]|uniref:Condensation domain-containing protein n=1 Tax=Aspergillus wentii DTO 134E9 TaxID=1073089 RepID=A0A1L9R4J2_ASPWE|nr:uncharacterized protein ASPWEDRAFT_143796 [Aspergillus wentii DTO 134E9]OJJ29828.1 hypothetical protein ASPWEDRAFT_143796 [Aspergillus wentii DTO 134E9]
MLSAHDHLLWRQTTPGRWERDLDEAEQCYTSLERAYEGTGRHFFAISGHISLSVAIDRSSSRSKIEARVRESLLRAWVKLRYDHPTIASWVEYDIKEKKCKKIYEALQNIDSEDDWMIDTFILVSNGQTGAEWCNSDPPVPRLPTLFLVKPPLDVQGDATVRYDLVLRCHHDIIDGVGTLHLLDNLFKHASESYANLRSFVRPRFGDECINLSPPFRVVAGIPTEMTAKQKAECEEIVSHNASLRKNVELATVPFKAGIEKPGAHQRVALKLPKEKTSRVLQACKKIGVSVTHAYHAAIAISLRDVQERKTEDRTVRYINYCLINERSHCKEPYSTPQHAATVYHSVSGKSLIVDMTVPAMNKQNEDDSTEKERRREEFTRVALRMKNHYLDIRNDADHLPMTPYYWSMNTPEYLDPSSHANPPIPSPNQTPSASISSMGIVDQIISPTQGPFELDNPWVTGEELGTGFGLFLGTWRGQLTLSGAYNDAWHDEEEVMAFLNRCNDVVCQGLDL